MRLRLTKKLATVIDGIDLSAHKPGDIVDLTWMEARLLVAEGWAVPASGGGAVEDRRKNGSLASHPVDRLGARAADWPGPSKLAERRLR